MNVDNKSSSLPHGPKSVMLRHIRHSFSGTLYTEIVNHPNHPRQFRKDRHGYGYIAKSRHRCKFVATHGKFRVFHTETCRICKTMNRTRLRKEHLWVSNFAPQPGFCRISVVKPGYLMDAYDYRQTFVITAFIYLVSASLRRGAHCVWGHHWQVLILQEIGTGYHFESLSYLIAAFSRQQHFICKLSAFRSCIGSNIM